MTAPAIVNIFAPTPRTKPSACVNLGRSVFCRNKSKFSKRVETTVYFISINRRHRAAVPSFRLPNFSTKRSPNHWFYYGRRPIPPSKVIVSPLIYFRSGEAHATQARPISFSASGGKYRDRLFCVLTAVFLTGNREK